jgi:MFS family permease
LLVAGIGDGLVIPSNQTHTLAEVPPTEGGSAAGVMQTGQRIGSAIGMAAASVFFAALTTTRGNYLRAFQAGLIVVIALVVAALVIALFDMIAEQHAALDGRGGHAGWRHLVTESGGASRSAGPVYRLVRTAFHWL